MNPTCEICKKPTKEFCDENEEGEIVSDRCCGDNCAYHCLGKHPTTFQEKFETPCTVCGKPKCYLQKCGEECEGACREMIKDQCHGGHDIPCTQGGIKHGDWCKHGERPKCGPTAGGVVTCLGLNCKVCRVEQGTSPAPSEVSEEDTEKAMRLVHALVGDKVGWAVTATVKLLAKTIAEARSQGKAEGLAQGFDEGKKACAQAVDDAEEAKCKDGSVCMTAKENCMDAVENVSNPYTLKP